MSRKITDIYKEYKIVHSLQMHMLRVAAVTKMIVDNYTLDLDRESLILAALVHDLGNIVKMDNMTTFPDFFEPEGVEYWSGVRDEFVLKYGDNDHHANFKILHELEMPELIISIVDQNDFRDLCTKLKNTSIEAQIMHYADGRVSPHGVLSYFDRMEESGARYRKDHDEVWDNHRKSLVVCGLELEQEIFANCKIKPTDITNESIAPIIEELRGFVIE